jgi:hypothetical protein
MELMDASRFDAATRSLTAGASRRKAITLVIGGMLSTRAQTATEAKKRKRKKKTCKSGLVKCKVKMGKKKKTICVDAQTDPANCGGCNRSCAAGIACVNGACQDVATCTPACPNGRDCFEGSCTCAAHGECEVRADPSGEWCVNPPGHPTVFVCGCLEGYTVCAAGERCSNCCSNAECEESNPGAEGIICPSVPANAYLGRLCCLSNGAECGSSDHCCSRACDTSQGFPGNCACLEVGQPCGFNQSCCSGGCSPTDRKCA